MTHLLDKHRRPSLSLLALAAHHAGRNLSERPREVLPDGEAATGIAERPPVPCNADDGTAGKKDDGVTAVKEKPDRRQRHAERILFDRVRRDDRARVDTQVAELRRKLAKR